MKKINIGILDLLYNYRSIVLVLLFIGMLINSYRFLGDWTNFFSIIIGQTWFGQAFYSFVARKRIMIAGGANVEKEGNIKMRTFMGLSALLIYMLLFFLVVIKVMKI